MILGSKSVFLPLKKGVFDLFWGYFPPVVGPRDPYFGVKMSVFGG